MDKKVWIIVGSVLGGSSALAVLLVLCFAWGDSVGRREGHEAGYEEGLRDATRAWTSDERDPLLQDAHRILRKKYLSQYGSPSAKRRLAPLLD